MSAFIIFLSLIGFFHVITFVLFLLRTLHSYFLRRPINLPESYGSWALITGPTDGIGKSISFELARRNLNLILVARNPAKLASVAAAISASAPQIQIKTLVFDFSGNLSNGLRALKESLNGVELGVFVNNAGTGGTNYAEYFHEVDVETWMEIVKVNLEAATAIEKLVVEEMMKRKKGAVVNIGSGSAFAIPSFPLFDVYAATKAYMIQFSKCVHHEYKDKGIDVQCQIPMFVSTNMIKDLPGVDHRSIFVATPDAYARAAVPWIGYGVQCVPYFPHFVESCIASIMPDSVLNAEMLKTSLSQRKPE